MKNNSHAFSPGLPVPILNARADDGTLTGGHYIRLNRSLAGSTVQELENP